MNHKIIMCLPELALNACLHQVSKSLHWYGKDKVDSLILTYERHDQWQSYKLTCLTEELLWGAILFVRRSCFLILDAHFPQ
jgi:hypothetical protein